MRQPAIVVDGISKQYRIGTRARYGRLTESLSNAFRRPFSRTRSKEEWIWALKDVSFQVEEGEVLGVIGRNGAGKTTLLKLLSRITEPTSGTALLQGRVGALLEVGTGFHPELTGRENVFLNGAILGMRKHELRSRFDEIVSFAEIERFIDTPVKRYSSGMHVRLAFAVAAHLEPEILVVDEVLAVGDYAFQQKCLGKMEDAHTAGRTVLLVSHNMAPILQLCSKVMWLDAGEIRRVGDPQTVVGDYLHDSRVPLGEARLTERPASHGVLFDHASLQDASGAIRQSVGFEEGFSFNMQFTVQHRVRGLVAGIRLRNERNVSAMVTTSGDVRDSGIVLDDPGEYEVQVDVPGGFLTPGRYYAELALWSPEFGHHHSIPDGLAFEISSADIPSLGDEVIRPPLPWKMKFPSTAVGRE